MIMLKSTFHKIFGGIAMTNSQHANENLTVHFKVKDYGTWRTAYDGRETSRHYEQQSVPLCRRPE